MNLSTFVASACASLGELYPGEEVRSIVVSLYSSRLGLPSYQHVTEPSTEIDGASQRQLDADLERLIAGEPLQYVLGYCEFYSRRFKVNSSVLIPRPETEQLVQIALESCPAGGRVLDLCTGSGCIAWSIFYNNKGSEVTGVDISAAALELARSQFEGPSPDFVCADILRPLPLEGGFDYLVSNPPYILPSEKPLIHRNVLDYEPSLALFVPEDDSLVFYRAVCARARELHIPAGVVEINPLLSERTAALFREAGYSRTDIIPDLSARPRFVRFSQEYMPDTHCRHA
ncbi:MAG: peptide chain release factor N(5)-glutamine methyltransferase [Bacteroidales bacterium]|nr:peptide chain release factor N(5)-glutamine methyltransferase [Bacteroidales bacterium]